MVKPTLGSINYLISYMSMYRDRIQSEEEARDKIQAALYRGEEVPAHTTFDAQEANDRVSYGKVAVVSFLTRFMKEHIQTENSSSETITQLWDSYKKEYPSDKDDGAFAEWLLRRGHR